MQIALNHPYKSIATLKTDELPNFAVLIGRNGAGKTQLFDALKIGIAEISGVSVHEIEMYDMATFHPPNTGAAGRHANGFAIETADLYMLGEPGTRAPIETAAEIFERFVGDGERHAVVEQRHEFARTLREDIRHMRDFAVFASGTVKSSKYHAELYRQVIGPLVREKKRRKSPQNKNHFDNNPAALVSTAMKLAKKLPHELTRDDIIAAAQYEGDIIANTISAVFAAYKVDQYSWAHKQIETKPISYPDLINQYRAKHPPPWIALRKIISEMRQAAGDEGLFDFEFSDPDDYEMTMHNLDRFSFKAEMTNRTNGAQYDLGSLSSGEKILMALCLIAFNQHLGRRRPKLLLLDELDAVLHPSMAAALVTTLKSLFVPYGTKVLLTSHSPITVAMLEEDDIFRVARKNGDVNVSSTTKAEAINELSEGIATVDTGLRIATYDKAKVTILTEGHNARHLKRWAKVYFPSDVHVFDELTEHTNDGQLLMYGRLLGRMSTNTHFVIVWDCDAFGNVKTLRRDLPSAAKVTPFAFKKRTDNKITSKGIENNYDEKILKPFSFEMRSTDDGQLLGWKLRTDRKKAFADHVFQHGTHEYFTHFQELRNLVSRILESL